MLVTSAGEVLRPSAADFVKVVLNQALSLGYVLRFQAEVCRQLDARINPELRFTAVNVDVSSPLLAREEVEPKPFRAKHGRAHRVSLAQGRGPDLQLGTRV